MHALAVRLPLAKATHIPLTPRSVYSYCYLILLLLFLLLLFGCYVRRFAENRLRRFGIQWPWSVCL